MNNSLEAQPNREAGGSIFAVIVAVLGLAFFINGHSFMYSQTRQHDFSLSGSESAQSVSEGSALRKVTYLSLGLFGGLLLLRQLGRPFTFSDPLAYAMLAYWAFCCASVIWSTQPSLTLRRVIVLSCCIAALFGCVRQLRRDQIVWLALICSFSFSIAGLLAELALGNFQPWSSGYRFSGTVHPNSQGQLCALACIAAYTLARVANRGRFLLYGIAATSLLLLILTGSRTACIALIVGVGAIYLPSARREKMALASAVAPAIICTAAFIAAVLGYDVERSLTNTITLGRNSNFGTLSGRLPLWSDLIPQIVERPGFGQGYLSFWTAERIASISERFRWTVPDAHNEYIDSLLNLGVFGAGLLALVVFGGLWRAYGAYLKTAEPMYGFFAAQIAMGLFGGCFESGFAQPLALSPFITALGVAFVACRLPAELARKTAREAVPFTRRSLQRA